MEPGIPGLHLGVTNGAHGGVNGFAAGLFTFFSNPKDAETLVRYAKSNLPEAAARSVAKAVDEIDFRAEFKERLVPQLKARMPEVR